MLNNNVGEANSHGGNAVCVILHEWYELVTPGSKLFYQLSAWSVSVTTYQLL